ncbi:MAG: sensor histidine kinase [Verrucomicrobia bacterium]|nr:MAG: sensor histidine kinase [Verrucomicrobiota bacterium]
MFHPESPLRTAVRRAIADRRGWELVEADSVEAVLQRLTQEGEAGRFGAVVLPLGGEGELRPVQVVRLGFGRLPVLAIGGETATAGEVVQAFRDGATDIFLGAREVEATLGERLETLVRGGGGEVGSGGAGVSELRAAHRRARALARQLVHLREEERRRIAREIHDELGQALSGLKMDVAWLERRLAGVRDPGLAATLRERLGEMARAIDATVQTTRRLCTELRPGVLDDLGLAAAIQWQVREFERRSNLAVKLELPGKMPAVHEATATAVFRVFQEILTNVARHAQASGVSVRLAADGTGVALEVRDDGVGFREDRLQENEALGLLGMRERMALVGGRVVVQSAPGEGTTVRVWAPAEPPEDAMETWVGEDAP